MAQAVKIFSKSLTQTDIKKRMAIPTKILPSLPGINRSHAVTIHLMYETKIWPIVCSTRKKGYKKPVFSIGWRNFVVYNKFNVGDKLTLYKAQEDQAGSFCYRVQVEKPVKPSGDLSPRSFSLKHEVDDQSTGTSQPANPSWDLSPGSFSLNHEVDDQSTGTSCMKACNFQNEKEQLLKADARSKPEEAIMELANVAVDAPVAFVDHVIPKPASMTNFINVSADQATSSNAHFKTKQESNMKFFGIPKSIFMGEPPLHSYYMTNEEREIKSFALAEDGAMTSATSQAVVDAYCKSHTEGLNLDLILGLPTPYAGEMNLDLTLAPPL